MSQAPPIPAPTARDEKHLHLLAVFHFVVAALALLEIALLVLYIIALNSAPEIIDAIIKNQPELAKEFPTELVDLSLGFFTWFLAICLTYVVAETVLNVVAGFDMLKRRRRTLSLFAAALNCLSIPLGTTLGIFTFIVLSRESVRLLYESQNSLNIKN